MRNLMCVMLALTLAFAGHGPWYMRVVARDDTAAGQAEKLRVRDELLACYSSAEGVLSSLPRMLRAAESLPADARAEIRIWAPSGYAPAPTVYVTLGSGNGHNWWGVLCGHAMTLAGAEETEAPDQTEWTWPVWDWLCRAVRKALGWGEENRQAYSDESAASRKMQNTD